MFLGEDLPLWLLLALGAALAAGNAMALIRPQPPGEDGKPMPRPPLLRTMIMIGLGSAAALAALISLIAG